MACGILLSLAHGRADAASKAPTKDAKEKTTQVQVRAGKTDNPNFALARQFSEAIALATNGSFALDVKESQGTVQNVIDAPKNNPNTIFTASHGVVTRARHGAQPFKHERAYNDIRALFPLPAQTVHWIVRQDSGVSSLSDLSGHTFVPGANGSVSQRVTLSALQVLGIEKQVHLLDIDVAAAPDAVMSNKVSGLAMAGSFPIPRIADIAKATPIRILSLPSAVITKMVAADDSIIPQTIPKSTYPSLDADVETVAVPAGIYTTRHMSNAAAYALTKAFWSQLSPLAEKNPAWRAVTGEAVATLGVTLHPGALRFYKEAGITVPASMR
ncbi:MAG TPA: TAXI family TRAP transporter solute-binding subunit [Stellaceae bacterium]|nr:TAXI family TRAP transporter solute-binding subunit [Stellaceae bacterium]